MRRLLDRLFGRRPDPEADSPEADEEPGHIERTYLEFVGGTSAKFYAVVLHGDANDRWAVRFNFGRIGHPRAWDSKVEDEDEDVARAVFEALIAEKSRGGYEDRPWPARLQMPGDAGSSSAGDPELDRTGTGFYVAASPGVLPPEDGGQVGSVELPPGVLVASDNTDAAEPVIWISRKPMDDVARAWRDLAGAFSETGLWPLVMELEIEPDEMSEIFFEPAEIGARTPATILRAWWSSGLAGDPEADRDALAPHGRHFPGLAGRTAGEAPLPIISQVASLSGHLGIVAVSRPADVLGVTGWTGAANYDLDPGDQSTVLRSWEDRFDAYVVGLGWDTITLGVGRPPRDMRSATAIAAEHYAFCPDNVDQGAGSIREYSELLVGEKLWPFWWD